MLFDEQGRLHDGGALPAVFEPGERMLELTYPTEFLYKAGATGPFVLDTLRLFEHAEGWIAPLEYRSGAYRTQSYGRAAFRYEKILLNGEVEARGADTNGDGQFENLVVEIGVEIDFPGLYGWHAVLASGKPQFAWSGTSTQGGEQGQLRQGSNRVRLEFPGACIHAMPDRGGYYLAVFGLSLLHRGEPPKGAPRHSFEPPAIAIPSAPPPSRFEASGPEPFVSSLGGSYSCSKEEP
jgi:hypothetical protein